MGTRVTYQLSRPMLGRAPALRGLTSCLLLAACGRTPPIPATAEERASFVTLYHGDTTVVERFRRTSDSLVGELYLRPPGRRPDSGRVVYRASLAPDARVRRIELVIWRIGALIGAAPERRWVAEFGPDSVVIQEYGGTAATPFLRYA